MYQFLPRDCEKFILLLGSLLTKSTKYGARISTSTTATDQHNSCRPDLALEISSKLTKNISHHISKKSGLEGHLPNTSCCQNLPKRIHHLSFKSWSRVVYEEHHVFPAFWLLFNIAHISVGEIMSNNII